MPGTFRAGRIFGFDINVHWTWFFIFFLVTWTFATGVLEDFYGDWTAERRWIVAAAISLIFFVSILLHEMSHSVVARRYGIPVSGITLFVFGGVSSLTKEPENSRQEFQIAIVGPLTSLALGLLFAIGFVILDPIEEGAAAVSANLAMINVAIGVFNLIPGFPLDGGRVLRSIFWAQKRNLVSATRTAARAGTGVAYGMMALGVAAFFFVSPITGIWLFLIGNFLRAASTESYEQVFIETALKGVPASAVARRDYVAVGPETTLTQLVDGHLLAGNERCFPVVVAGELLGLVTLDDIRKVPRDAWPTSTVYRAMTPFNKLRTVTAHDTLPDVLAQLGGGEVNQVPLVDGKQLLGLIHRADVIKYIQTRQQMAPA